ncbi:hypothetical protein FZEAL_6230 [Fusarium zealandicum]|uniref:Secreted protein n=1 Tax=Fusarium zealandicum TaxID=1053134 RepID=A0A8H4UI48_9HYPO|nr:hypothetical protein FZEAL_6230 [Fusarium zealandicum]
MLVLSLFLVAVAVAAAAAAAAAVAAGNDEDCTFDSVEKAAPVGPGDYGVSAADMEDSLAEFGGSADAAAAGCVDAAAAAADKHDAVAVAAVVLVDDTTVVGDAAVAAGIDPSEVAAAGKTMELAGERERQDAGKEFEH